MQTVSGRRRNSLRVGSTQTSETKRHYPTFVGLPQDNDINLTFYNTVDGFNYMPRKHWCFLAEIIDIEQFIQVKLIVRDKAGATMPVAFPDR